MKRILLMTLLALMAFSAGAQTTSFREFCKKYSGREGYTTIEISGTMISAMGGDVVISGVDAAVGSLMDKVDHLVIVITENPGRHFLGDIEKMIKDGGYVSLTSIKEDGQSSCFYVLQKKRKSEFLMTVLGEDDNIVMSITGTDLDVSQVTRLARRSRK